MILSSLIKQKLIHPPEWLDENSCAYLTQMGSVAYGVSGATSDIDIYGFAVPPKDMTFPHLKGEILGFGRQIQRYEQWQEHHVYDAGRQQEFDFSIYSIVKYFNLCMEGNPNMLDSLFVPERCVLHINKIGKHVRENRKLFLHKGCFHKFKGYAYAQMSKIKNKTNSSNEKRTADIEANGFDTKFAYHLVRITEECEQILMEGDLDIERNREHLKAIRRGELSLEQIEEWFAKKNQSLEELYVSSSLQHSPDEAAIKKVLLACLEMAYGSLDSVVSTQGSTTATTLLNDLKSLISKYE